MKLTTKGRYAVMALADIAATLAVKISYLSPNERYFIKTKYFTFIP